MGMLLCEKKIWDVWSLDESVRAEIGQILHTHTHWHTHAAKLVVAIALVSWELLSFDTSNVKTARSLTTDSLII